MEKVKKAIKQRSTWAGLATIALTVGQLMGDAATGGAVSGVIAALGLLGGTLGLIDDDKAAKVAANDRITPVSH